MAADLLARMETARLALEQACELLIDPRPQSLEACLGAMGVSARILVNCHTQLEGHTGDRALLAEAGRLREAVRRTSFLLQTATDYHMTWFRILRAKTGGYTAHGDPALVSCSGRVCLQG